MRDRSLWIEWAALVATLGTAALAVGIAVQEEEGNPLFWWVFAGLLIVVAAIFSTAGVLRPWLDARRIWKETRPKGRPGWSATHRHVPRGMQMVIYGPHGDRVPIVLCEFVRKGSTVTYLAYFDDEGVVPPPRTYQEKVFPDDFIKEGGGTAPAFDHLPWGCYRQTWWGWDRENDRKVPLAWEVFPIFPATSGFGKAAKKCLKRESALGRFAEKA